MKIFILIFAFLTAFLPVFPQQDSLKQKAREIVKEGSKLYNFCRAEKISRDIVDAHMGNDKIAGRNGLFTYFRDSLFHTIYVQKFDGEERVFCDIKCKESPLIEMSEADFNPRDFNDYEKLINSINTESQNNLIEEMVFTITKGVFFNLVITEVQDSFKVYFMTSPLKSKTLTMGYDFILTFDKEGEFISKEQLHNGFFPTDYSETADENGAKIKYFGHSHLSDKSQYITATDVCNFMMYGPRDGKIALFVMSENYISIFKYTLFPELIIKPAVEAGEFLDKNILDQIHEQMRKSQK